MFGEWRTSERDYIAEVRRYRDEVGGLDWAAPQDWMVEPQIRKRTGLSLEEHQRRTVENLLQLRDLAPDLPFVPVLQGWTMADYWRHMDAYQAAGVSLESEPLVGVGTLCRRQGTAEAERILASVAPGIRLHGFGFKIRGLLSARKHLASADSLAWSIHARRRPPLPGHDAPGTGRRTGHKNCANCPDYALAWRERVVSDLGG